jgi:hypothetical protein
LLAVVFFAFGHSLNTYRIVTQMSAQGRELAAEAWVWVRWMMGLSVGLAIFVLAALIRRRALRLTLGPEGLVVQKMALSSARRRRRLAWDDVRRASVERGLGRAWTLSITAATGARVRLPLSHAVADDAKRSTQTTSRAAIETHPLVSTLSDALGPRLTLLG